MKIIAKVSNNQFMESPEKFDRIVEARMKLKARFEEKMKRTPSVSDNAPRGTGSPNRHGMPTLPIGQTETFKWPVLDLGGQPDISHDVWRLTIDGAEKNPLRLTCTAFLDLPQTEDISDFHCVTTWSKLNMRWKGVRLLDLA